MPSRTIVKEREKSEGQQGFWPCAQRERERERERERGHCHHLASIPPPSDSNFNDVVIRKWNGQQ